mgnify:CR=1 FL=1
MTPIPQSDYTRITAVEGLLRSVTFKVSKFIGYFRKETRGISAFLSVAEKDKNINAMTANAANPQRSPTTPPPSATRQSERENPELARNSRSSTKVEVFLEDSP